MLRALQASKCELIVLAGFMKMIGPRVLAAYRNRIVNIHPSLLPRHGGKGMYGMHVHAAVIASGDSTTGVTVHLVDEAYDHGRVLAQSRLSVEPRDTPESLSARILKSEHAFLVETLGRICRRELALDLPG
jgi:phosphoribosylglycinamide formyltransferase-1